MELKFKNLHEYSNLPIGIHNNNIYFDPSEDVMYVDLDNHRMEFNNTAIDFLWTDNTPASTKNAYIDLTEYKMVVIYMGSNPISKTYVLPIPWSGSISDGDYSRTCEITTEGVTFGTVKDNMHKLCDPTRIDGIR